jgi:hypothetical protein
VFIQQKGEPLAYGEAAVAALSLVTLLAASLSQRFLREKQLVSEIAQV